LNAQYPRSNGNAVDMPISGRAIAGSEGDPPQEILYEMCFNLKDFRQ
jgi:hypothetical protein